MNTLILRRRGNGKDTCSGIIANINNHNIECIRCDRLNRLRVRPDILIRWGSQAGGIDARFEINTPRMIHSINNKIEARRKLTEKRISIPKTYYSKDFSLNDQTIYPVIGRETHHSQGRRISICRTALDVRNDRVSTYWSEFIPKDREFRVFVFFGRVLGMCEKIPNDSTKIAWNNSLGNGIFKTIKSRNFPLNVSLLALKAAAAMEIDFSAVDIISKDGHCYVLELNSAPSCSEYRQRLFGKAFNWLINETQRLNELPNHFEVPEDVRSFKSIRHPCLFNNPQR